MISIRSLIALTLLTCLLACTEEETYQIESYVDMEMIPYFEQFAEEGLARGVEVNYQEAGITALFDLIDHSIAGQCTRQTTGEREIIVDSRYWRRATALEKELVIFHELGHCFLHRSHLDESAENGTCVSLMHSGLGSCRGNYTYSTRDDYLDELFSQ